MIRAVLDTNVIVSGIIKGNSPPGRILEALFQRHFIPVTTEPILAEIARVLTYPKIRQRYHIGSEEVEHVLSALTLHSDFIHLPHFSWKLSRDPDDDLFVACAIEGGADYLVTGDQDLLTLKVFREIQLVTPETFLRLLNK